VVKSDCAVSHAMVKEILQCVDQDWLECLEEEKLAFALEGTYYVLAFSLALKGEELPLIELRGIHKHWNQSVSHPKSHVVVALLGRFKNELGESHHLMPVLYKMPRGLKPGKWVERTLQSYSRLNLTSGYMFRTPEGFKMKSKVMEGKFHDRLELIKNSRLDLIAPDLEVVEEYGVSRSFRQGGTSEATNNGVPPLVIELNGRWRKSNQSGASRPNITVREHYTDIGLVLDQLLEFSRFL